MGGSTGAVAARGSYVYLGVGMELEVLDASAPGAIRQLGASPPLAGAVRDIALDDRYAYVAAGEGGLYILDISNPAQPVVAGNYATPGYAEGVAVSQGSELANRNLELARGPHKPPFTRRYAYLADGPGGLRVVDVTQPANPREISAVFPLDYVFGVAVADHRAYLAAAGAGLLVADISHPASPVEVASLATPGYAYGVAMSGQTVYVADGWAGLLAVDVSRPSQPLQVGATATPGWAMNVTAVGSTLYLADALAGVRVIDASDRTRPTELGGLQYPGNGHAQRVAAAGNLIFVADRMLGLEVVDVSNPVNPVLAGSYAPMPFASGVAAGGGYAYVGVGAGLEAVDVTTPGRPQEAGNLAYASVDPTSANTADARGVVTASGGYLYTAGQFTRGLFVIDASDPRHLQGARYSFDFGSTRDHVIQGGLLAIPMEWGLRFIDISNPLAPCQLSFINFTGAGPNPEGDFPLGAPVATGVALAGNLAYAAVSSNGVWIVDISDPRNPVKVGEYSDTTVNSAENLVLAGNLLYVASNFPASALRVLDISDPLHPVGRGSYPLPATLTQFGTFLAVAGSTVLVADGPAGLLAIDVSNPDQLKLAGNVSLPGNPATLAVDDRNIYVAAEDGGLIFLQAAPGSAAASSATLLNSVARPAMPAVLLHATAAPPQRLMTPSAQTLPHSGTGATCTVSSTADSGTGTLRQCLTQAPAGLTILFDPSVFPPGSPGAIKILSPLPGLSQPGQTLDGSNAGVILDGSGAPPGTNGIQLDSAGGLVRGLQIVNFNGDGITVTENGASGAIQGNVIGANGGSGIDVNGGSGGSIIGNYIGVDATGTKGLGNLRGINLLGTTNVTIGGSSPADRNVISGNTHIDIDVVGAVGQGAHNRIVGNYIGCDAAGKTQISNNDHNIYIEGGAPANFVGGNVIVNGVNGDGVFVGDAGSSYNEIVGNFLGLDATGTTPVGSSIHVAVTEPFNRIGGVTPQERNVVAGGIYVFQGTTDNVVIGNYAGTDATGTRALSGGGVAIGGGHNIAEANVVAGPVALSGADNAIVGNSVGIGAGGAALTGAAVPGIYVSLSEYNAIQKNQISGGNTDGIQLFNGSNLNWLRANRVSGSRGYGLNVVASNGNLIEGNAFLSNSRSAYDSGQGNRWDNGRTGNYWSDYTGKDLNGSGVGSTPYIVAPNGVDHFPLMADPTK